MLKKISKILLGSLFFSLIAGVIFSSKTYALDYKYNNLKVTTTISEDSSMHIDEDYEAFFYVPKHGIIRKIYRNFTSGGKRFHTDISNIDVEGRTFETDEYEGEITIKIGDYYIELTGKQDYHISFDVYGLIRNFSGSGFAELYWNLVGSQYDTEFDKVRAEIKLPKPYTGFNNSDILIATKNQKYTPKDFPGIIDWSQGDKIIIEYDEGLTVNQGLKLGIRFPKDYFTFNHERQESLIGYIEPEHVNVEHSSYSKRANLIFVIVVAIAIFVVKYTNSVNGKINLNQGKLRGKLARQFPVIIQYAPPVGINSAEAGMLLHRGMTSKDMLSLIYKWAAEGLIKLNTKTREEKDEGVQITKLKEISGDCPRYEREFFDEIVPKEINESLWYSNFHTKLKKKDEVEGYGIAKGWFHPRREYHLQKYVGITFLIGFFSIFASIILTIVFDNDFFGMMIAISIFLTWIVGFFGIIGCALLEKYLSRLRLTERGAALVSHLVGYRQFLATCEEAQLKTCLSDDPLFFNKVLPYAVAFGFDTELIKKLTPILKDLNIDANRCDGGMSDVLTISSIFESSAPYSPYSFTSSSSDSSYSSDSGFDSGSSFDSDFGSDSGGGNDGGGSSW